MAEGNYGGAGTISTCQLVLWDLFQDRDKGLRIHLGDSVEELKKFNARRKLKAVVLSAVNSSKWYPYDDTNADSFSDFGDDEVSACGKSHHVLCLSSSSSSDEKRVVTRFSLYST
jgi:hypothetical protein